MTCNSSFVNPLILLAGKLLCDKYSEMRIFRVLVLLKQFTIKKEKTHTKLLYWKIYIDLKKQNRCIYVRLLFFSHSKDSNNKNSKAR